MSFQIRIATGADSLAAAQVVREVFAEYGFTWEEEGYNADLYDLQTHYLAQGDLFWVAEAPPSFLQSENASQSRLVGKGGVGEGDSPIVATCGLAFFDRLPGAFGELVHHQGETRIANADCSLERLYVRPSIRRSGLGSALLETAIEAARRQGRTVMEIWSDKKLTLAHRLYERYGAVRAGDRICDDPDQSPEWGMALRL